jgi:hypothetical protein
VTNRGNKNLPATNPGTENLLTANLDGWKGLAAAGGGHDRRWDGSPGPAALGEPGTVTGGSLVSVRNVVPTLTSNKRQGLSLNGRC